MKNEKIFVSTLLTGALLTGCTAQEPVPRPTESVSIEADDMEYTERPTMNFSVGNCNTHTDSWAAYGDADPNRIKEDFEREHTIGLVDTYEGEMPVLATGALIRSLGASVYKIMTSEDEPSEAVTVDLKTTSYSRVLDGGEGYDAVLSGRIGDDDIVYFRLNCLPERGFLPDEPTPLPPFDEKIPSMPSVRPEDQWDA